LPACGTPDLCDIAATWPVAMPIRMAEMLECLQADARYLHVRFDERSVETEPGSNQ
jgi:hypothetical protein